MKMLTAYALVAVLFGFKYSWTPNVLGAQPPFGDFAPNEYGFGYPGVPSTFGNQLSLGYRSPYWGGSTLPWVRPPFGYPFIPGSYYPREYICRLPPRTGLCTALFVKYYYNQYTGRCERFVYGGCGGNANKFDTRLECERRCGALAYSYPPTWPFLPHFWGKPGRIPVLGPMAE